ncbi:MAG: leucine-rich repeat domain-containing protein [Bacteroidales bacterium]|nr:leucine-rich repeat domain-containing protein [Bacteroidales bacterium]
MKKIFLILICAVLCSVSAFSSVEYFVYDGMGRGKPLFYSVDDNDVYTLLSPNWCYSHWPGYDDTLSNYGCYSDDYCYWGDVVLPEGTNVISDGAFTDHHGGYLNTYTNYLLTTVTIPSSVTNIGAGAFDKCDNLTAIYYTGDVKGWCDITYGDNPLWDTYNFDASARPLYYAGNLYINGELVTDLVIPNTVTEIKAATFYGATCLTSVTIPNSVTTIGPKAFGCCSNLTDMTIPFVGRSANETTGSVTTFGYLFSSGTESFDGAVTVTNPQATYIQKVPGDLRNITVTGGNLLESSFNGYNMLTSVTITNSGPDIGEKAFYECTGLTSITLPSSVTSIGENAFYNCNALNKVNYTGSIAQWCGIDFYEQPLDYAHNLYIDDNLVSNLVIPDGVTNIKMNAFSGASCLMSVTFSNSVENIGDWAFWECSGLTDVTIPSSVTSIGTQAFQNCRGLTSLTISNSVPSISIGPKAFAYCTSLTTVNFNAANCTAYGSSNYPVFGNCSSSATLNIGSNVTVIPSSLFNDWTGLARVNIPNSVTSIEENAFYNCTGMNRVNYAGSITQWCGIDFYDQPLDHAHNLYVNNSLVTNLVIPEEVTAIKMNAFSGATCITSVTISNSVESIGNWAFFYCSGITNVTIPSSVTSIGGETFSYCSGLSSVTIPNSVTSIGGSAFSYCTGLATVNFNAANCTSMGSSSYPVFKNCSLFSTLNIGENVTIIPDNAFKNCTLLASIVSEANNPPALYTTSFDSGLSPMTPVIVPCGTVADYERYWTYFRNIQQRADCGSETSYTINVTSENPNYGTVTGGGTYTEGSVVTITAIANDGYEFAWWNDGNTSNPRQITVIGNANYIATFIPMSGIDEEINSEIALFPNPTSDILNITSSETISEIEIVNVMGQVVRHIEVNSDNAVCDVEELPNGFYVVRIHGTDTASVIQKKFIKE